MGRVLKSVFVVGAALVLAGCASTPKAAPTNSPDPTPSVAASLIPTAAPANVVNVDPANFAGEFGESTFKVGDGPTWCTINEAGQYVICEQSEADANYAPIPAPSTCDYSYGYQVKLYVDQPADGSKIADFTCSSGAYADPTGANVLNSGEQITLAGITCFVEGTAARCSNESGNYIVLGPDAWAIGD